MFWIVHQSFGPSDRPGCESITTQSCPVWVYGESVTDEHWERWTGGGTTCRVPPWRQTDASVSCFFSISKSSAFLIWIVGHSQAPWCHPALGSCPWVVDKHKWGFSHLPRGSSPWLGATTMPPLPLCAPAPPLPRMHKRSLQVQRAPWTLAWISWLGLWCHPHFWAHTGSPVCHSHITWL